MLPETRRRRERELGLARSHNDMAWRRILASATLAAAFIACGTGFAVADPPPWSNGRPQPFVGNGMARSHAVVSGRIVGVDFASASILVQTSNGRVPIAVTPSTSIFRGNDFASFAELRGGSHVDVDVSDVGGRLVAQIIRIR